MGIELARKAHTWLRDHKNEYNPAIWITETQTDLAGRICLDAGADPVWLECGDTSTDTVWFNGREWTALSLAQRLCDLTIGEANHLFGARVRLTAAGSAIACLENDRALFVPARTSVTAVEHAWTDIYGHLVVAAHRRTVIDYGIGKAEETFHASRQAAHDYASDLASCRTTNYQHNDTIWETTA